MVAPKLVPGKCWKALNNARIHQDRTNRTRLLLQIEDYFKEAIADHWSCLICVRCHLAWKFLQPQTCVLEESKTQWKSWLEGFEVHGQRPMKKRNCMIFDKYIASICYPMLYLCYIYAILHSRSVLSFFGSTLDRWTPSAFDIVPLTSPTSLLSLEPLPLHVITW